MLALWMVGNSESQEGWTKQDRQGPVSVAVTLTPPPEAGAPVKVKIVLDTHTLALDEIKFEEAVVLRTPEGTDISPTAVEQATGSGHHREAVLLFPSLAPAGEVRLIVKNVGGVAERNFSWELPPAR
jgi:hypothetical protein